jgi:ribonuclease M5
MLKLEQALLVEGKYDAARLSNIVDGTILTTDGFRVFKDGAMQRLLKRIAAAQGLIILTDSDAAGFKIRHFVTGLVGAEHVLQAYVPAIAGKESRKAEPGKEGLLGVEGVSDDLIVQGLETALASKTACRQKTTQSRSITYTSGTANSAENRRVFLRRLGLPPRLSKKELLQVLNTLYTYDALNAEIKKL